MSMIKSMKFVIGKETMQEALGLYEAGDECLEENEEWIILHYRLSNRCDSLKKLIISSSLHSLLSKCSADISASPVLIQNIDTIAFLFSSKVLKYWSNFQGAIVPGPHSEPWKTSSMTIGVTSTKSPLLPFHF